MAQQNNWQQTKKPRQPVRDVFLGRKKRVQALLSESSVLEREARIKSLLEEHIRKQSL